MAKRADSLPTPSTFAERLRQTRLDRGLSQAELARAISARTKTKVDKALISQWEHGRIKNPQMDRLEALTVVLGVSHRWLLTGKGERFVSLDAALESDRAARALDRAAFQRAVSTVVERGVTDPQAAARAALELYDVVVESPATEDVVLRRLVDLVTGRPVR